MKDKQQIISGTADYVKKQLSGDGSGHDWWHVYRVWNVAKHIGQKESADMFLVEIAALLHDIADYKFHGGDEEAGPKAARKWLESVDVEEGIIRHVCSIIKNLSFKGANVATPMETKEGMVVQDADRLDAIGAVGIARTFAYGGFKGREMYNPEIKPVQHSSFEEYKKNTSPTINHFYEKLLLLKDLMNTETAKKIAQGRQEYMEKFLEEFYSEWNGEC